MKNRVSLAVLAVSVIALTAPASAQSVGLNAEDASKQYVFDLGIGAAIVPEYQGADSFAFSPLPIINVHRFYFPIIGQLGDDGSDDLSFFLFPSLNYIGERKANDDVDLTGTNTVDWAVELGLGAGVETGYFRAFGELRQGINGHSGQVGRLGLDGIYTPNERWEVTLGPRAEFATDDFLDTYFGVTAAEAAASGGRLTAYDPGSGFTSVGLEGKVTYAWTDRVHVHLEGGYERLVGDAADSPIVNRGSENQFTAGVGLSYRFGFNLFD